MKRSRFTQEQIIAAVKKHESGAKASDICREYGVTSTTFYTWRSKYHGMEVSDARRLRCLEDENSKLKRKVADLIMAYDAVNEILAKK